MNKWIRTAVGRPQDKGDEVYHGIENVYLRDKRQEHRLSDLTRKRWQVSVQSRTSVKYYRQRSKCRWLREEVPGTDIRVGSADHPLEEFTLK